MGRNPVCKGGIERQERGKKHDLGQSQGKKGQGKALGGVIGQKSQLLEGEEIQGILGESFICNLFCSPLSTISSCSATRPIERGEG